MATLLAALSAVPVAAVRAQPQTAPALPALLDSLERAGFSGSVLVADRRNVLAVRSMGLADERTGRPLVTTDIWRWASVSKQITAALVLREVDAGRITLDAPVSTYLPEFTNGTRARITVRHLLQHTSGLPLTYETPVDADDVPRVYRERGAGVGDDASARLCGAVPDTTPGVRFTYNNCDYLVLGALLRARTGKSTAELLTELLGGAWSVRAAETVRGYEKPGVPESPLELPTFGSAGAFTGSLDALLAFDRLLLGSMLSDSARAELWRGNPQFGYAALGAWAFESGLSGCDGAVRIVERRGGIGGVQARNVLLPDKERVVIVFTNRADVDFGEVWQGRGLMYELLSAAAGCAGGRGGD